jgi:hypothetical protein
MAGSFTDYLEDKILKHVFTNTAYTSPDPSDISSTKYPD